MADVINTLRELRLKAEYVPHVGACWLLDADTFRSFLKRRSAEYIIHEPGGVARLLGLPYRIVVTEEVKDYAPAEITTAVREPMPVLIAVEYRDRYGLVRYLFADETDDWFKDTST